MAVKIQVLGNEILSGVGAEEFIGAKQLKNVFEEEFNSKDDVSGTIIIKPNFKAIGQNTEDIDIVVWFNLENYNRTFSTSFKFKDKEKNSYITDSNKTNRSVDFSSLLLTIELKSHNNEGIVLTTNDVKVKYQGKLSSAYDQSVKQKYALKNFSSQNQSKLAEHNIQITNLIWFPNFKGTIPWGKCNLKNLILGNTFSFKSFIETAFATKPPIRYNNNYYQNAYNAKRVDFDINQTLEKVFTHYDKVVQVQKGDLSRRKLEKVIQKQLDGLYKEAFEKIGKETLIISGVPGSGKTLILLRFSYHLALNKNSRSLIVTYNKALTADVNRLSRLAGFKDDPSSASVQTSTCISLILKLLIYFGIYDEAPAHLNQQERSAYFKTNFTNKYETLLDALSEWIQVQTEDDLLEIKKECPELNYEFIFIDESQDWFPQEKDALYTLYGANNFIISYGSHQYIRNVTPLNWANGTNSVYKLKLDTSYRQKTNLCHFIKNISARIDFEDEIKINTEIPGGGIEIYARPFVKTDYQKFYDYTVKTCKNAAYDILLLVNSADTLHKELKHNDVSIHDGTIDKNKLKTPEDMDALRVFNYQSSRGLEGWVVIANNLDVFVEQMKNNTTEPADGMSLQETKLKVVARWLYMVLSRPIDTLVITLKNPHSKTSSLIIEAAKDHPDFCNFHQ